MVFLQSHGRAEHQCNFFFTEIRKREVEKNEHENLQLFMLQSYSLQFYSPKTSILADYEYVTIFLKFHDDDVVVFVLL